MFPMWICNVKKGVTCLFSFKGRSAIIICNVNRNMKKHLLHHRSAVPSSPVRFAICALRFGKLQGGKPPHPAIDWTLLSNSYMDFQLSIYHPLFPPNWSLSTFSSLSIKVGVASLRSWGSEVQYTWQWLSTTQLWPKTRGAISETHLELGPIVSWDTERHWDQERQESSNWDRDTAPFPPSLVSWSLAPGLRIFTDHPWLFPIPAYDVFASRGFPNCPLNELCPSMSSQQKHFPGPKHLFIGHDHFLIFPWQSSPLYKRRWHCSTCLVSFTWSVLASLGLLWCSKVSNSALGTKPLLRLIAKLKHSLCYQGLKKKWVHKCQIQNQQF